MAIAAAAGAAAALTLFAANTHASQPANADAKSDSKNQWQPPAQRTPGNPNNNLPPPPPSAGRGLGACLLAFLLFFAATAFLLPYVLPAVQVSGFGTALLVALVLGLLNAIVRPILVVLTLPITVLTLGLFLFVINGLMFWLVARMFDGFTVTSFWWAVLAALIYSVISSFVSSVLLRKDA